MGSLDATRDDGSPPPPSTPAGMDWRHGSTHHEDGRRFLQQRVALFGAVMFWCTSGFFLVEKVSRVLGAGEPVAKLVPSELSHLFACGVLLVGWLLARSLPTMARGWLLALDGTVVVLVCSGWGALAFTAADSNAARDAILATVFTVMARAVIVPSRPSHTLLIAAGAAVPMPLAVWVLARSTATSVVAPHPATSPAETTLPIVLWVVMTAVGATITSQVIYGLRQRVRKARQLGQYTLEGQIGAGGMGVVYRARHALLKRPTAIKLMSRRKTNERMLRRFEREVQLTSQLSHPNTITIYDYGRTADGVFYYAMEYLDGFTLDRLVNDYGPLPAPRVIHLLRQACGALGEAHRAGLIHRDVKPSNLIVCQRGARFDVIKVLDFGLVKQLTDATETVQTATGIITGTPHYIAPEGIDAPDQLDGRADLYALGCVAYFLLTGREVFAGSSVVTICSRHLHDEPEPPSRFSPAPIAGDLEALILRCLAKHPDARPQSAAELERELAACEGAGQWSQQDALASWQDIARPSAGLSPDECAQTSPATIDVALAGRSPRASDDGA